eukprot:gene14474-biopygen12172
MLLVVVVHPAVDAAVLTVDWYRTGGGDARDLTEEELAQNQHDGIAATQDNGRFGLMVVFLSVAVFLVAVLATRRLPLRW